MGSNEELYNSGVGNKSGATGTRLKPRLQVFGIQGEG